MTKKEWENCSEIELIVNLADKATPKQFYDNLMLLSKLFKIKLK